MRNHQLSHPFHILIAPLSARHLAFNKKIVHATNRAVVYRSSWSAATKRKVNGEILTSAFERQFTASLHVSTFKYDDCCCVSRLYCLVAGNPAAI